MRSSEARIRLEEALGKKPGAGAFFSLPQAVPETVGTGIPGIDSLSGGIPRGALTEVSGACSSGRTSLMLSLFSGLTGNGEVVGLVDPGNAFDPASAAAFGVDLGRLIWIRAKGPGGVDPVLKIADLLLGGGGFGLIAIDLTDLPAPALRRVPLSVWFRFRRAVEHTPTILLCLSPEPVLGAQALALRLDNEPDGAVRWTARTLGALVPRAGILRARHARPSEHRMGRFRLDHPAWIEAGCTEQLSGAISS